MWRIKSSFLAIVFFLHFFGMQSLSFAQDNHHCGSEQTITHECCVSVAVFSKHSVDFDDVFVAVIPAVFELKNKTIALKKAIVLSKYTDEIFPPPWLEWKNIVVMRC